MMSTDPLSHRPSFRVADQSTPATEFAGPYVSSAPETTASSRSLRPGPERRARRTPAQQLEHIARTLSDLDHQILAALDRYGFATTRQLQTLLFIDHSSQLAAARAAQRTLFRLGELGVVEHLDRRVGGLRAGSASFVWRVGLIGDRLLRRDTNRARARRKEPSLRTLEHRLMAVDCIVRLTAASRAGSFELQAVQSEPESWRPYLGPGGVRQVLKPDLTVISAAGDYEDHWFLEVDRATESLPTLLGKCTQYERYRRSGEEQHRIGVFPWVVWVVPTATHAVRLRRAIDQQPSLDSTIFKVTVVDKLVDIVSGAGL